jgi:integrase
VRNATWDEIDTEAALWTIPAERMKMKKEHRVPLSSNALKLLASLPREGRLLFPGTRHDLALSDMTLTAAIRRMDLAESKENGTGWKDPVIGRTVTAHGFRSTFRDWTAEAANFPREVCEHALAHSLPDKVEASYRRTDLVDKRVALMQSWADFCNSTPSAP